MKQAFYDECGHNPDNLSDIGARLNIVASELYSICCNTDFVKRQSFVQTAQGEYLDYHAQLRDMTRKEASRARGVLTFGLFDAINEDVVIKAGTICASKNEHYIQFATDEDAVIPAGQLSVDVGATALENGRGYNAPASTVNVFVNAPARVEWVNNYHDFVGGSDVESDESLRKRIIDSFKHLPSGFSKEYMQEIIMSIDEILDCKIYDYDHEAGGSINIYVKTSNGEIDSSLRQRLDEKAMHLELINEHPVFALPRKKDVEITIISSDYCIGIEDLCWEYFSSLRIGEALDLLEFRVWLSKKSDYNIINVISRQASGQYVLCGSDEYLYLNGVGVSADD